MLVSTLFEDPVDSMVGDSLVGETNLAYKWRPPDLLAQLFN